MSEILQIYEVKGKDVLFSAGTVLVFGLRGNTSVILSGSLQSHARLYTQAHESVLNNLGCKVTAIAYSNLRME